MTFYPLAKNYLELIVPGTMDRASTYFDEIDGIETDLYEFLRDSSDEEEDYEEDGKNSIKIFNTSYFPPLTVIHVFVCYRI